jgi:hypothetical protein
LISAGSSAVEMFVSSRLRMLRPVYSDTVCRAGGAGDQDHSGWRGS